MQNQEPGGEKGCGLNEKLALRSRIIGPEILIPKG